MQAMGCAAFGMMETSRARVVRKAQIIKIEAPTHEIKIILLLPITAMEQLCVLALIAVQIIGREIMGIVVIMVMPQIVAV